MILTHLELTVVFTQKEKHFTQLVPGLEVGFTLQCLMCGHAHRLESPTVYRLRPNEKPHTYKGQIATVVKQTRSCDNCGMLSTLPKRDAGQLEKQLEQAITADFLEQHTRDQPPFLAQRLFERLQLISS